MAWAREQASRWVNSFNSTLTILGKVSIKKTLKVMEFSILINNPISITFFGDFFSFHEKYKDDQNGLTHPEN